MDVVKFYSIYSITFFIIALFPLTSGAKVIRKIFSENPFSFRKVGVSLHRMMVLDSVVRLRGNTVRIGDSTRCCVPILFLNLLKATELCVIIGKAFRNKESQNTCHSIKV